MTIAVTKNTVLSEQALLMSSQSFTVRLLRKLGNFTLKNMYESVVVTTVLCQEDQGSNQAVVLRIGELHQGHTSNPCSVLGPSL